MFSYIKLSVVYPRDDENIKTEIDQVLMHFYDQDAYDMNDALVDYEEPPVFYEIDGNVGEAISKKVKELGIDIILKEYNYNDEDIYSRFYIYKKNGKIIVGPDTFNTATSLEEYHEIEDNCFIELMKLCRKHGLNISVEDINHIKYWSD
jgi:hypothetical protein